jgi:hypothetical protein
MKSLLLIFILTFSTLIFSSPSYAGWTKVIGGVSRDTIYVDFERIREYDGFVYYWRLNNYLKPTKYGDLSTKVQNQGDCKLFRFKNLSTTYHAQSMGRGTGEVIKPKGENANWKNPSPNSVGETILKLLCSK